MRKDYKSKLVTECDSGLRKTNKTLVVVVVVVRRIMGEERNGRKSRRVTMQKKMVYVPVG